MRIDADFPTGRIAVEDASDAADIRLRLPADPGTAYQCWFHFRVTAPAGGFRRFRIVNAAEPLAARLPNREAVPNQWQGAGPVASHDGKTWLRLDHHFDGRHYHFWHLPRGEATVYAKFAPWSPEQEALLLARAGASARVARDSLGPSGEGRPITRLRLGAGALQVWIIARQHPSETQGAFFMEGLLERLLTPDPAVRRLLDLATLHLVPNANPDGWLAGQTRATPGGVNLNREWSRPAPAAEVAAIRGAMEASGCDVFLDAHADNELAEIFAWPAENTPAWREADRAPFLAFESAWAAACPDYIPGRPYPGGCPAVADTGMAWNWAGACFPGALSILLEQTYKDVRERPDPLHGWSPDRARALGRAVVLPLLGEAERRAR